MLKKSDFLDKHALSLCTSKILISQEICLFEDYERANIWIYNGYTICHYRSTYLFFCAMNRRKYLLKFYSYVDHIYRYMWDLLKVRNTMFHFWKFQAQSDPGAKTPHSFSLFLIRKDFKMANLLYIRFKKSTIVYHLKFFWRGFTICSWLPKLKDKHMVLCCHAFFSKRGPAWHASVLTCNLLLDCQLF